MASLLPDLRQPGLGPAGACRLLGLPLRLEGVSYFMTGTRLHQLQTTALTREAEYMVHL